MTTQVPPASWIRDWWHVIAGLTAAALWWWRRLVTAPQQRLAAVEETTADTAEQLREVRVGMARMSDAHAAALHDLTARIDRVLELTARREPCQRRHFDPNDEAG